MATAPMAAATAAPTVQSTRAPAAPAALTRIDVAADDGHVVALWHKQPRAKSRGDVLLVHGRTWSGRPDFDLQVPGERRSLMDALVLEGYAAYAIDLRGYGGTPRDDTGWVTPDRAERDVWSAVQRIVKDHGEPPAILGWSLGALTAQLTAQRHPEHVAAVILYGYPRSPGHKYRPGAKATTTPPKTKTTAKAAAEDFIIPGSISKAAIEAFVEAALSADPVKADWRALDEWNELDPAKVRTPTLLIHGERDPYAPVASQGALFAKLGHPDRQWVIVAGGDHAAHLENSGPRFVHAVTSFLARPK